MFVPGPARLGSARIPLLPAEPADTLDSSAVAAEGMFLASRDFTAEAPGDRDGRRALTERAYLLRAGHRPTPHGVFAGVTGLEWTTGPVSLRVGAAHRPVSYPNPDWLHRVCDQVLDDPDVLHGLTFTTNPLGARRGDRYEAERPGGGDSEPVIASVRATPATGLILRACRDGATWKTIIVTITQAWPDVPTSLIDETLRELTRDGLLVCDLFPADVRADPLAHIIEHLPATHALRSPLSRLHLLLADADAHPPGVPERADALRDAREVCDAITDVHRPVCVDTAVDARIRLPVSLAAAAAEAAGVLWRTGTSRDPLSGWHARFLDRYGPHRLVPLREVTDEVTGLGTDAGHAPPQQNTSRDSVLTALYARAIAEGAREVVLDEAAIDALSVRPAKDRPPASAEIHARIIAPGACERDTDRFLLAITRTGQPAGAARGRFTTLLPTTHADSPDGGRIVAELAFTPRHHVGAALTSDTRQAPYRIRLGGPACDGDLLLDELALFSDGHRLALWSTRYERHVVPFHRNPIGHSLMPPLAGWLCLLGQHPAAPLTGWSWGPVEHAPFLPRVRFGDTILAPARWRLPASLTGDRAEWMQALNNWRRNTAPPPPGVVVTDDDDRQIPLRLDRDDDTELLRRYVRRGLTAVSEPHGGSDTAQAIVPGPHGHHIIEAVFALTASTPDTTPVDPPLRGGVRGSGRGSHLPGGPWLSTAIPAPRRFHDAIITALRDFAADHRGLWDRWFFLRYHTDVLGEHVRVRFGGEPETLGGHLLPALHQLCTRMYRDRLSSGLAIESYDQEIERYGGLETMAAAETVFYRDSEVAAALLDDHPDTDTRIAAAATSAATIARIVAGGDLSALAPYRLERADRPAFHSSRPLARRLDDSGHIGLTDSWNRRSDALHAYAKLLPANRRIDCASSLIHMHINRLIGDNHHERIARALAKDLIARETR